MGEGQNAETRPEPVDVGRRLQMLSIEYSGLASARSLAYSEAFSRASMFLTTLSAGVVALALVSQATGFADQFVLFALLLLPVVLFIGVATYVRLVQVNTEDIVWIQGLNRIRHAWIEIDPGIETYLVTDFHDDPKGIAASTGHRDLSFGVGHAFVTAPGVVGVVDAVVAGALAGLVVVVLRGSPVIAAGAGAVAFLVTIGLLAVVQLREIAHLERVEPQRFPTPPERPAR